jgi:very-short-patch-repair endonuclease
MNYKRQKEYEEYLKRKQGKGLKKKPKNKKRDNCNLINRINYFRNKQIKSSNPLENKIKNILEELEIKFVYQKVFRKGKKFKIADFYLTEHKLILECDGSYHESKESQKKDAKRTNWIINNFDVKEVIRIDYKQFFSRNKEESTEGLMIFLENL